MTLYELRKKIDTIDEELLKLFCERMETSAEIAEYKKRNSVPVYDAAREKAKLRELTDKTDERFKRYVTPLYSLLFELSRSYQEKIISNGNE